MKKLITLFSVALLGISSNGIAQITTQNFETAVAPALPTGWTQTAAVSLVGNDSTGWKTGDSTALGSPSGGAFMPPAHTQFVAVNDDKWGGANNTNSLLMTKSFSLTGVTNAFVKCDMYYFAGSYNNVSESMTLEASTNGGTTWTVLQTIGSNTINGWQTRYFNISSLANSANVMLGFRYNDGGGWLFGAAIDNFVVYVPPANDLGFISIKPNSNTPTNYALTGSNVTFSGTVTNYGITPVNSFTFTYQQGTNAAVPTVINTTAAIAPLASYNFTAAATPYTMPAIGNYPFTAAVTLAGDVNQTNDTLLTTLVAPNFMPNKRLTFEEGTGSWCGYCVRGIVYMDSLWFLHPNNVSPIAVHDNLNGTDNMAISAYDSYVTSNISGYPSVLVDRREVADPSQVLQVYDAENSYFGYADITLSAASTVSNQFSVTATVKPAINLNGVYHLALVLTEDSVHGTASTWGQHNYYSSSYTGTTAGTLVGQGLDYYNLPAIIPAAQMYYKFVARSITNTKGDPNTLPGSMTAGTNYTHTYTVPLTVGWKTTNMRAFVMLIDSTTGHVLNSNYASVPLGISNVAAGVQGFRMYPNPTTNATTVGFELKNASNVQVEVYDVMGRVVVTAANETMSAGQHFVNVSTANLAAGIYTVKIQTENGNVTDRLSVVK
ncbi:MAG: T9SS type A sorting domain-containing protein [Bacteroidota bacterium]